jgi:hypothetical protein
MIIFSSSSRSFEDDAWCWFNYFGLFYFFISNSTDNYFITTSYLTITLQYVTLPHYYFIWSWIHITTHCQILLIDNVDECCKKSYVLMHTNTDTCQEFIPIIFKLSLRHIYSWWIHFVPELLRERLHWYLLLSMEMLHYFQSVLNDSTFGFCYGFIATSLLHHYYITISITTIQIFRNVADSNESITVTTNYFPP